MSDLNPPSTPRPNGVADAAGITLETADGQQTDRLPLTLRPFLGVLRKMAVGQMAVTLPDGRRLKVVGGRPGPEARLTLHRWRVFRRAVLRGDVGLGEAFMEHDWDSPDLAGALHYFAANTADSGEVFAPKGPAGWGLALAHALRANTPGTARRNIAAHYDLGNAFYGEWLDTSMTYSSALFAQGATDLETAQRDKYRALIAATGIGPGDHVLEIGCGWGGFACLAAREAGCRVTAVTLSEAQRAYAEHRIAAEGLTDRVTVVEQDYRDISGQFDKVVSIEMIEAVGERYWPIYFAKVAEVLAPGGRFGLQAITIRDALFPAYRSGSDFLQTYIFPGGMLLPEAGMRDIAERQGLRPGDPMAFGKDYARTLALWRERFDAAWPRIAEQGFDDRFRRMWQFYLSTCEAGFRSGLIDVAQTVFHKP